ncbi:MAG: FtsK/SpoIIIE domain-containing protein [Actinomycetota bacterium]|nr:FtsK/SpoIIIE domain-containing protein [Actinomycetota bacterium]
MGADGKSKRGQGREVKTITWAVRHPGVMAVPVGVTAASTTFGLDAVAVPGGWAAGGAVVACGVWYRGHPDSFDRFAAPVMRAWRRRWVTYVGWRWRNAMEDCDLFSVHRRTGESRIPRVLRVRSYSPTVDTLWVKLAPGHSIGTWQAKLPELADALKAERVGIEKIRPRVIGLVVQRARPFPEVIDAPDMPGDSASVDLGDLYVGETEYGTDFRVSAIGDHLFVAGATGAGKNSIEFAMLRGLAPMIRDGLVRLWIADPKQTEFAALAPIAHRYAHTVDSDDDDDYTAVDLIREFRAEMEDRQKVLRKQGKRKFTVSRDTPLDLLILDELGAITAYGDAARLVRKDLAVIGTQGRSTGHRVHGFVQEPTKDTVPIRDLFTMRVCLRVTSQAHVDMVLGDDARLRGALADEIPNVPDTAGVGYVIRPRSRLPIQIRAAYVTDEEITELVDFVLSGRPNLLKVVA